MGQFASAREYPRRRRSRMSPPECGHALFLGSASIYPKSPWILQLPDEHGRYHLMPMLDAWTDVLADPWVRAPPEPAGRVCDCRPRLARRTPWRSVEELRSATNLVWIIGRTYCTGTPEDHAAVHAIQDQYKLVPLSAYGKPYMPPSGRVDFSIDMRTPPREQVERMDTISFFELLAELMKKNPPYPAHAPIVALLARIGLVPGQGLDLVKARLRAQPPGRAETRRRADRGTLPGKWGRCERLGVLQISRGLRHRLRSAGLDYPLRPWGQHRTVRCLSDRQGGQHGET